MKPSAAPLEVRAQLEDLGHHLERARVALRRHDPRYWFSTSQRPSRSWRRTIRIDCRMSSGSKPEIDDRPSVLGRDELERARADDRRDVAGADEAVQAQVGRIQQGPQRRHDRDVVADAGEVRHALGLRALERERGRGRRRLEADREEDDLAVGVLARDPQRVQRRVDHPHVRPLRLRLEQRELASRARAACRRSR